MSANYFNLLKYAATGIASPDMTCYDRMRASTLMGGVVQTLTGIPPLSFKSDGTPLISWSMKGNGQQTGTPTPDNPIMPTFCGVRTAQIIDYTLSESGGIDASGNLIPSSNLWRSNVFYEIRDSIVLSFVHYSTLQRVRVNYYDANYLHISREEFGANTASGVSLTIPANAKYFKWTLYASSGTTINLDFVRQCYIMLNLGSTALPFEPFGWAEKITCAGQTVPVYLGQTQTVRRVKKLVLTGEESWEHYGSGTFWTAIATINTIINRIGLCNAYKLAPADGIIPAVMDNGEFTVLSSNGRLFIKNTSYANAASFKAYLAAQYAAGTPVTIWYVLATEQTAIVNEPLCKIGDYADELSSTDAAVTIPTAKGQNTITVDTPIQPSEMTITFKG